MKTALIVEDFLPIAEIWRYALLKAGYSQVEIIRNSEFVEEFVEKNIPDLIIMDISLEGRYDGIYLTEVLSQKYKGIRILGVSIHSELQICNKMLEAGAQGYFVKSSPLTEFQQAVESIEKGETFICDFMQETMKV